MRTRPRAVLLWILLLLPLVVSAQDPTLIPPDGKLGANCNFVTGEFDFDCVPLYVGFLIKVVFGFSGGFALVEIVKAGYQIAMGGFMDKEAGKRRLTWALVGLAVSIIAFLIIDFAISALLLGP